MRTLTEMEVGAVAGGDWSLGFDLGIIDGEISGDESIQDIASGLYNGAMEAMVGALTWFDSVVNSYSPGCSGGGGR